MLTPLSSLASSVKSTARRLVRTGLVVMFITQLVTVLGLWVTDRFTRRRRQTRPAPHHGEFDADVQGSRLTVYTAGNDLFDDMLEAIDGAQRSVMFQTFIWRADEVGQRFMDAINRAAERGVQVHLIRDLAGTTLFDSWWRSARFFRQLHPRVHDFRKWPVDGWFWRGPFRATGVNHSKVLVVDDTVGFIGGINIGDPYAEKWRDTHLRETGPSVWSLRQAFVTVWNANVAEEDRIEWTAPDQWNPQVAVAANLPLQLVYPIRHMYLSAFERARSHIWVNTPYFVPDQQLFSALVDAARRGVDVRLMVPRRNNHILVDWVARGFYGPMLDDGIRIFLYEPAMIHAKTAVVDGTWATIGTANLDRLSLAFNYEINIEVVDPDFGARIQDVFLHDAEHCEEIDPVRWRRRNAIARITEIVLVPLRPFL